MTEIATVTTIMMLAFSSVYAAEYHVSPNGLDSNDGSQATPFKTISAAAQVAQPGDVVTVHEGVYREYINPPRGGTSDDNRIIYQAAPGEKVVIKGSEVIKGWEKAEHDTWKVVIPNRFFGTFNPYSDLISGDWFRRLKQDHHTGAVYLNGHWLNEAATLEDALKPTGGQRSPVWFSQVNESHTTIWAQFTGIDPNQETVEINVRQCIFYPDQPGRNYITVRGFTMKDAATNWAPPTAEQKGLIGTHWSKGWIIEHNEVSYSKCTGITLGKYGDQWDNTSANSAEGYVETIKRGLADGWSKETIGHHIVRNNHIHDCEQAGIVGSLGAIFSRITGNEIHDIHVIGLFAGAEIAGIKFHGAIDSLISDNHIYRAGRGVWLDWMTQGTRVTRNVLHDNNINDIFVEVNHGPFLIDNNLCFSGTSILDLSQGSAYVHNLFLGKVRSKSVGNRETPYFTPHTLKEMKLCNITHRDARFFNNAFLGEGYPSEGYVEENLQLVGNIHLQNLSVTLENRKDGVWLRMPRLPTAQDSVLVTTERLGKAAIPDAPFEKPDGTPYRLDHDYFGEKRAAENPAPGPFKRQDGEEILLKVWPNK
jgi:alpha-N-arabinofuranosidase